MIELNIDVPEIREFIKEIVEAPGRIFEIMRFNVLEIVGRYLSFLMESELTFLLGCNRYERTRGAVNYRNGAYHIRFTLKGIGQVTVRIPGTVMESLGARSYPEANDIRMQSRRTFPLRHAAFEQSMRF